MFSNPIRKEKENTEEPAKKVQQQRDHEGSEGTLIGREKLSTPTGLFAPLKLVPPTTRLLYRLGHQIKSFLAGLLRALSQLKCAGASWKKPLLTTGSLFQEAPRRQRLLWNVSRLAVRQAVYTAVHKTLAGRRLSPDLPRSPLQGRDHPLLRPISYRLRAASPGPGAGPLGERTHRLPRPQHWGQCLNRVKGLPSAWPSLSRGRG